MEIHTKLGLWIFLVASWLNLTPILGNTVTISPKDPARIEGDYLELTCVLNYTTGSLLFLSWYLNSNAGMQRDPTTCGKVTTPSGYDESRYNFTCNVSAFTFKLRISNLISNDSGCWNCSVSFSDTFATNRASTCLSVTSSITTPATTTSTTTTTTPVTSTSLSSTSTSNPITTQSTAHATNSSTSTSTNPATSGPTASASSNTSTSTNPTTIGPTGSASSSISTSTNPATTGSSASASSSISTSTNPATTASIGSASSSISTSTNPATTGSTASASSNTSTSTNPATTGSTANATNSISTVTSSTTNNSSTTNKSMVGGVDIMVIVPAVVVPGGLVVIGAIILVVVVCIKHRRAGKNVREIPDDLAVQDKGNNVDRWKQSLGHGRVADKLDAVYTTPEGFIIYPGPAAMSAARPNKEKKHHDLPHQYSRPYTRTYDYQTAYVPGIYMSARSSTHKDKKYHNVEHPYSRPYTGTSDYQIAYVPSTYMSAGTYPDKTKNYESPYQIADSRPAYDQTKYYPQTGHWGQISQDVYHRGSGQYSYGQRSRLHHEDNGRQQQREYYNQYEMADYRGNRAGYRHTKQDMAFCY